MSIRHFAVFPVLLVATAAFGQGSASSAHADFIGTRGEKIGKATITQTSNGVKLDVSVAGLPPGKQHGKDNPKGPHAGDMSNFEVGADGTAKFSTVNTSVTLREGTNSLFHEGGAALVIHEKPDDYKTDPTGNAGNRIACGVVQK